MGVVYVGEGILIEHANVGVVPNQPPPPDFPVSTLVELWRTPQIVT
jgi:hypothetical protein